MTTTPLAQGTVIPADASRSDQFMNAVFRVTRYAPTFAGLVGRDLTPLGTIETYSGVTSTPTFSSQPQSQSVTAGASASFSVSVSGASGTLTYQWQRLSSGASTWSDLSSGGNYSGATTAALTVSSSTTAMSGDQFRCVVGYSGGSTLHAMSGTGGTSQTLPARLEVSTLAGLSGQSGAVDGTGRAARFSSPAGLTVDRLGIVYVADMENQIVRRVTLDGVVTTLAGQAGSSGGNDGTGQAARFSFPSDVAVDGSGNVFVADTLNHTIRKVSQSGAVSTLAGLAGSHGSTDGTGSSARFYGPEGLDFDSAGNLYVADTANHTIRMINAVTGTVRTVAGMAGNAGSANGTGSVARFHTPSSLAAAADGSLYVADEDNHTIRKIDAAGTVSTLAGLAGTSGAADGMGSSATFNHPSAVAVDSSGNILVADSGNHTIRRIRVADGTVTTLAGLAGTPGATDGIGSEVQFDFPSGIAADEVGGVYIADTNSHTLRLALAESTSVAPTQAGTAAVSSGSIISDAATLTVTASGSSGSGTGTSSSSGSGGGGGGGGAISPAALAALGLLTLLRWRRRRGSPE